MKKKLITGALGQIGSELITALIERYGADRVIASDMAVAADVECMYEQLDVTDAVRFADICKTYQIDEVYHLAALLSAVGEQKPDLLWDVNMNGLKNALDLAREHGFKLFVPSSIAAFGPSTPRDNTPQVTVQRPTTIYGISKVSGELLCDYYAAKYGVDVRGIRFPGIISYKKLPGGGTTDYAVHIYFEALKTGHYSCYIAADTHLDMIYMPDAIKSILHLMDADPQQLDNRNAYNITAMSLSPQVMAEAIKAEIPAFTISYDVDPVRQAIAESWPNSLDDCAARSEWNWQPDYDLAAMTQDMLRAIKDMTEV